MEQQLSLHLKNFNKRVQVMNQTNAKDLTLSSLEARNLHNEIFGLLAQISDLAKVKKDIENDNVINVEITGGDF